MIQEITLDTFYRVVPISRTNTLGEEAVVELSQHNKNEIGEIANVQIVTKVYPWEQFTLIFDKLPNVEGVSYHLEYTYDLKNFEVIDTQLVELGTKLGADLQFPYRKEQLFIKIVARNQDGTSSTIIDVTFKEEPSYQVLIESIFVPMLKQVKLSFSESAWKWIFIKI